MRDGRVWRAGSLSNHQLLWHGSRTANFGGILSQGLRIAPPEAPVQGYMFGKGAYTAGIEQRFEWGQFRAFSGGLTILAVP